MKINMKGGNDALISTDDDELFNKLYNQFDNKTKIKSSDFDNSMFEDLGIDKVSIKNKIIDENNNFINVDKPFEEIIYDENPDLFTPKFKQLITSVNDIIDNKKSIQEVKYILLNNILPNNCRSGAGFRNRLKLYLIQLYKTSLINHYILYIYFNAVLINIIRNIQGCDTGPFESLLPRTIRMKLGEAFGKGKPKPPFSATLPDDDDEEPNKKSNIVARGFSAMQSLPTQFGTTVQNLPTASSFIKKPITSIADTGKVLTGYMPKEQLVREGELEEEKDLPPIITKQMKIQQNRDIETNKTQIENKIDEEIPTLDLKKTPENSEEEIPKDKQKTALFLSSFYSNVRQKATTLLKCYINDNVSLFDTAVNYEDSEIQEALSKKSTLDSMKKSINSEFSHIQMSQNKFPLFSHTNSAFLISAGVAGVSLLTMGADMGAGMVAGFLLNALLKSDAFMTLKESSNVKNEFQNTITSFNNKIRKTVSNIKSCETLKIYNLFKYSNNIIEAYCSISQKYYDEYLIKYNYFFQIYLMLCKEVKFPDINYEEVKKKIEVCFESLKKKINTIQNSQSFDEMNNKINFIIENYNGLDEEHKIMLINNISQSKRWNKNDSTIKCTNTVNEGEILGFLGFYITQITTVLNKPNPFEEDQDTNVIDSQVDETPTINQDETENAARELLNNINDCYTQNEDDSDIKNLYSAFNLLEENEKIENIKRFLPLNNQFVCSSENLKKLLNDLVYIQEGGRKNSKTKTKLSYKKTKRLRKNKTQKRRKRTHRRR